MTAIRRCLPVLAAIALAACGPDADALESRAVHALTTEVPALQAGTTPNTGVTPATSAT
jgi:hypothetical protein